MTLNIFYKIMLEDQAHFFLQKESPTILKVLKFILKETS